MTAPYTPENGHGEALPLAITDLRLDGAGEPRVLDLDVAERLGFARPAKIRDLIRQNTDELRRYGDLVEVEGVTAGSRPGVGNLGGRPGRAFLLNHDQAMIVAVLSRAPRAADVRQQLIAVFNAYRASRTAPAQPAGPSPEVEVLVGAVESIVRMQGQMVEAVGTLVQHVGTMVEHVAEMAARTAENGTARPADPAPRAKPRPAPGLPDPEVRPHETDLLDWFIVNCTSEEKGSSVQARELFFGWCDFCKIAGRESGSETWFGLTMRAKGFRQLRTSRVFYLDMVLKPRDAWSTAGVFDREGNIV